MKKLLLFCLIVRCGIAITGPGGLASSDDESSSGSESEIDKMSPEELEAYEHKLDRETAELSEQLRQSSWQVACEIFAGTQHWHVDKTPLAQIELETQPGSLRSIFVHTAAALLRNHVDRSYFQFWVSTGHESRDVLESEIRRGEEVKAGFLLHLQVRFPHLTPATALCHPKLHDLPQIIADSVPVEESRRAITTFLFGTQPDSSTPAMQQAQSGKKQKMPGYNNPPPPGKRLRIGE